MVGLPVSQMFSRLRTDIIQPSMTNLCLAKHGVSMSLIFYSGIVGAVMSTIQRLQKALRGRDHCHDTIEEVLSLNKGRVSILLTLMSGGIFAVLLYFFVASGSVKALGHLWIIPEALPGPAAAKDLRLETYDPQSPDFVSLKLFEAMARALNLLHWIDLMKMILLGFVAGFAERLVPDALDRLSQVRGPAQTRLG